MTKFLLSEQMAKSDRQTIVEVCYSGREDLSVMSAREEME
jgi:hypothetical protein